MFTDKILCYNFVKRTLSTQDGNFLGDFICLYFFYFLNNLKVFRICSLNGFNEKCVGCYVIYYSTQLFSV